MTVKVVSLIVVLEMVVGAVIVIFGGKTSVTVSIFPASSYALIITVCGDSLGSSVSDTGLVAGLRVVNAPVAF